MKIGIVEMLRRDLYPKYCWVVDAFRKLGHESVEMRDEPEFLARKNSCDLVLFSQRPSVDPRVIKRESLSKSCPWICWVFDLLGHWPIGKMLLQEMCWSAFDVIFCKNPDALPSYNAMWMDQAAPDWKPGGKDRRWDVLMPGTWNQRREHMVIKCRDAGFRVAVAGTREWARLNGIEYLGIVRGDGAMRDMFADAKVTLCENIVELPDYWTDRLYLAAAAGSVPVGPDCKGDQKITDSATGYQRFYDWDVDNLSDIVIAVLASNAGWWWNSCASLRMARANRYADRVRKMLTVLEPYMDRAPCP